MSKLTIKNRTVQESGEPASFGKAYREFLNRCWRDTPNGVKPNYSEQAINFMLDCAHIANGTSVKGLPQQGYTLTVANIGNLVGDCLHLCYEKNDGDTSIDIWLNPHTQFVNVDMMGITDPEKVYHVDFNARKNTADDFADFIENLPNYTGKSKTAESRKMTIRVHEASNVASWDDMAELFQELGYFPADDCPAEDLCAYDEMDTGLDAPEKVTIVEAAEAVQSEQQARRRGRSLRHPR